MYKKESFQFKKGDGKRYRLPEFCWGTDHGRVGENTIYLNRDWGDNFFYSPDPSKFSDGNLAQALCFLGYGWVEVDGEEYFTINDRRPLFWRARFEAWLNAHPIAESDPSDWEEFTLGEYDEPEIGEDGWIKDAEE